MKTLSDGTEVSARSYYFMLDWNEQNEHEYLWKTFQKIKLSELTFEEYHQAFIHATQREFTNH